MPVTFPDELLEPLEEEKDSEDFPLEGEASTEESEE